MGYKFYGTGIFKTQPKRQGYGELLTLFHPEWGNFAPPPELSKISRKLYE